MESLIKGLIIFSLLVISPGERGKASAADKQAGRLYFQNFMGHVHKEPKDGAASLTAIQCAQSVQVMENALKAPPRGWVYIKAGEDTGYIRISQLGEKRPDCFQEKYPKFYNSLNLDISDYYYWGRLSDHYIEGESLAQ